MHYFSFHIGDYKSHTHHLSLMEDLAFRRLLDHYYLHEHPIKQRDIARQIGMRDQEQDVLTVLNEFFVSTDAGFINPRADKEIAGYRLLSEAGKRGADKRWAKPGDSPPIAPPLPPFSPPNSNHEPVTINHEPIDTLLVKTDGLDPRPSRIACPTDKLLALFHQECPTLPRVMMLNDKRKKHLVSRWREVDAEDHLQTAEDGLKIFQDIFSKVHKSDFLCGRTAGRQWKSNFDWLIQPTNFLKVVEGQYDNRGKS